MKYQIECQGSKLLIDHNANGFFTENGSKPVPEIHGSEKDRLLIGLENQLHDIAFLSISEDGQTMEALINGKTVQLKIKTETDLLLEKMGIGTAGSSGSGKVKAPMPGLIVKILVKPGEMVEKGQVLLNFEAMKMENQLKAPVGGVIKELKVSVGDKVEKGQMLAEIS